MAVTSFIPQIWNAQMLISFRQQAIAAALVNRQYEGNAARGNVVKITLATDIAVHDYNTGAGSPAVTRTTAPDTVSATTQDLPINQFKNFDFLIDDIDRAQAAGSMQAYTQLAGLALASDADKFILSTAATQALAANTPVATTLGTTDPAGTAWNLIRDIRKNLNKQHVPMGQRVLIVNAEFEAALLSNSAKLTAWNTAGVTDGLRDANLGRLLGFTVFTSENLPTTTFPMALAFHQPAVAFVSQITETEAMRAQNAFSDRLRGLHVYGGKVIRPEGVAVWTATS